MFLITVPVFIWSMRLSSYITIRHKSEDYRYKQLRQGWEESGMAGYYLQAYLFVYVMQGVFSVINGSSVLYVNLYSSKDLSTGL